MELLLRNPGRVYSRENLLNVVWGYEYAGDYRTVDVHVRRLREKLELDPANPEYIPHQVGRGLLSGSMDKGSGAVRRVPFWRSLQTKFALTYIVIVAAVLILLNTYPWWCRKTGLPVQAGLHAQPGLGAGLRPGHRAGGPLRPRVPPGRWSCCGAAWE